MSDTTANDDDPFSCFGEDSEDEEVQENSDDGKKGSVAEREGTEKNVTTTDGSESSMIDLKRRNLIEKANRKFQDNESPKESIANDKSSGISNEKSESISTIKQETPKQIETPWEHRKPLYHANQHSTDNCIALTLNEKTGGNRGYVATRDLEPGTLLLVEEPIYTWPEKQLGEELGLVSVLGIMQQETSYTDEDGNDHPSLSVQDIVKDIEKMHPTKERVDLLCRSGEKILNDSEKAQIVDMMEIMQMRFSGDPLLKRILDIAKEKNIATETDNKQNLNRDLDEIDVFRMLLALRYNGFASGVYLNFAMFNHHDDPNCIKYTPESNDKELENNITGKEANKDHQYYSEVRTTRFVKKFEELTLSYIDPREVSHSTRRWHLWDQHRFDIGASLTSLSQAQREMELVDNALPKSSISKHDISEDTATEHVESAIKDFEEMHQELEGEYELLSQLEAMDTKKGNSDGNTSTTATSERLIEGFERIKALEMGTFELADAAKTKLGNDKHILLIRCYRLHLDSAELLLKAGEASLTNKQKLDIMCRFIPTSKKLLSLQLLYVGKHHPDIARTNNDLAMGISGLLSSAPNRLFGLNLENMTNFHQCSLLENECRKDYERIRNLYPRDVNEKIKKVH